MAYLTIYTQQGVAPSSWFEKEARVSAPDFAEKAIERYAASGALAPGEHTLLATFGEADGVLWLFRVTVEEPAPPTVTVERI